MGNRLTGLRGPGLDGLSVDPQAHFGAGGQGEPVQRVRLQALHGVEADGVEGDVDLWGKIRAGLAVREAWKHSKGTGGYDEPGCELRFPAFTETCSLSLVISQRGLCFIIQQGT